MFTQKSLSAHSHFNVAPLAVARAVISGQQCVFVNVT